MAMRVAHLLRKYNPAEWGGTETVIHQLFDGLRNHDVDSIVYCPRIGSGTGAPPVGSTDHGRDAHATPDPLIDAGCTVNRFHACVPVWGISAEQRQQMIAVGGNLMSFDLIRSLWAAPRLSLIHSHALGRVGGIGLTIARRRKIPFVVTIHGGLYDLPDGLRKSLYQPSQRGVEWGKAFGLLLRAHYVIDEADAILTCNSREAELIRAKHPNRRVIHQPHGVRMSLYEANRREIARAAFPQICDREVLLSVGRIDPVKNQGWLVEQIAEVVRRHPRVLLVLAGPCTDQPYGQALERRIAELGLGAHVFLAGKLPPGDSRLIGLMQEARVVLLPSISETFGLVILEAWAAGTPAISSRTSGGTGLIEHGKNGWLFDLERPAEFHAAIDVALTAGDARDRVIAAAWARVVDYDTRAIARRVKELYAELTEEHHALCCTA